jgi:hypothetical protein
MLPARSESSLQLVPNWNDMTMPETTPMPNDTAKILVQNRDSSPWRSLPASHAASSTTSHAASPIVNAGNRMWNAMLNANCTRARSTGSRSMPTSLAQPAASHPARPRPST